MQRNQCDKNVKIISAIDLRSNYILFVNLITKVYNVTHSHCKDYPNYFNWYWTKVIPGVINGTREILVCTFKDEIAGVAILKSENNEQKLCTFLILGPFRVFHVTSLLLETAFEFLGTTKPLITISDTKIDMFQGIIKKYNWEHTHTLEKGYYNNASQEIVFNGKIL